MKPCGAEGWCDSWATILLFLRLPSCQPLVKLVLADDLQHAVHLVVAEPAQFRASDFEVTGFGWSEVHMDRKAWHGVLLEAHGRNKKTADPVMRAQNHFYLAAHGHFHNARHHIVLRRRIRRVEAQGRFSSRGWVFQFRLRDSKLAIWPGLAEIPGELHACDLDPRGPLHRRAETFPRPAATPHQVQPDEEDRGESGPDEFQPEVAVGIVGAGSGRMVAISPDEVSQ